MEIIIFWIAVTSTLIASLYAWYPKNQLGQLSMLLVYILLGWSSGDSI
jgi:predicted membrane channel-forming protein YqfA (hemolysin III family)